jgi:MinD-like ATPase involved in chromosome partitioning or flagellar assembly
MARVVSVHSYRGGTGKSNLTANLATVVAGLGQRVGIVDTDIQSPGIHVIFGLDEGKVNRTLNDYLWGRCAVEDTAYNLALPGLPPGGAVYLIPASARTGEITRILRDGYDVALLNDGFQALLDRLRLDYLFIDTHPGLNEETLLSIAISDVVVLLLRPDRQDFQGTAVTVEVARKLNVPRLLLVINKVLPTVDAAALREEVEATYNVPVAGVIPLSTEMLELGSSAVFCLQYPYHAYAQEVRKVAQQVMA